MAFGQKVMLAIKSWGGAPGYGDDGLRPNAVVIADFGFTQAPFSSIGHVKRNVAPRSPVDSTVTLPLLVSTIFLIRARPGGCKHGVDWVNSSIARAGDLFRYRAGAFTDSLTGARDGSFTGK